MKAHVVLAKCGWLEFEKTDPYKQQFADFNV
jgi:hypothetical protein